MTSYWVCTAANVAQWSGPKYGRCPALLGFILIPMFYGISSTQLTAGIDSKYWGSDLLTLVAFVVAFVVCDLAGRAKWLERDRRREAKSAGGSVGVVVHDGRRPATSKGDGAGLTRVLLGIVPQLATISIGFVQVLIVVPPATIEVLHHHLTLLVLCPCSYPYMLIPEASG